MKFLKISLFLVLVIFLLTGGISLYLWENRVPLLEKAVNLAANELFQGSIRLREVERSKDWQLVVKGITGTMKTETDTVSLEIEKLQTKESFLQILRTQRSEMVFQNFRPANAEGSDPASGTIKVRFGRYSSVKIETKLNRVSMRDYAWLNPAAFEGLSGTVSGDLSVRIDSRENAKFNIHLKSDEKGGEVPARFLNFVLPYLPAASHNSKDLKKLIAEGKNAHFSAGLVQAEVVKPGEIQAQIKMQFPEQNLNLNLNLTIMVDERHAFFRAFKLLGLFKIKNSGAQ